MDIDERIQKLAEAVTSERKLKDLHKTPILTPPSQPVLKIDSPTVKFPPVRKRGAGPLFTSELKTQSPYNKL